MNYTIVIPTHNRPDDFKRQSEYFKDIKNGEVIFVENNSTTENIKKYKKIELPEHQRIIYVKDKSKKLGAARNLGVKESKGKWIYLLDDDDSLLPKFLEFLETKLGKLKTKNIYRTSYETKNYRIFPGILWTINKHSVNNTFSASSYLISKETYRSSRLKFHDNIVLEDLVFSKQVWDTKISQHVIRISSIYYNVENESITRYKGRSIGSDIEIMQNIIDLKEKGIETFLYKPFHFYLKDLDKGKYEDYSDGQDKLYNFFINNFKGKKMFIKLPMFFKLSYLKVYLATRKY